jgi:hypothetical protein
MAKIWQRIVQRAFEILEANPQGVRFSDLLRQIAAADPSLNVNSMYAIIPALPDEYANRVYRPSRGLYRLTKYRDAQTDHLKQGLVPEQPKEFKEEDFYGPFADWLVNEVEECTKAIPLGGNRFRDKWGTPDVIGKWEPKPRDIVQRPVEIVSAEIKSDVSQLVTAFGQACAYYLFSDKTYLVVSDKSSEDELARLDALCQVFGIGLVLFDSENPADPKFTIRCRPRAQEPDPFYTNQYMRLIEKEMFS